jgi:tryptophanyl-tRNA synthetase
MPSQKRKPRVLSGIQSSGNLHIGNYLGAIKNWVQDQDHYENYFMIADYHAITVLPDSQALRQQKRELIGLLLACGLDPNKSVIFEQSAVAEHMELAWILTCVTPIGWL